MKRNIVLISLITAIFFIASSFTKPTDSENWVKFKSFNGVDFYQKTIICNGDNYKHQYILFKYVNTTSQQVNLQWNLQAYYGENCRSCNLQSPNDYDIKLTLAPNQSISSNCDSKGFMHKVFVKDLNKKNQTGLSKFKFFNLR